MDERTIVTGFLEFADVRENPSALLAATLGQRFELLEVAFDAVDAFIDRLAREQETFHRLVMLGLRRRGTRVEFELQARNEIGAAPDVRGVIRGPGPIDPRGPAELTTTLFDGVEERSLSFDAGCYLCNYLYYRALRDLPGKHVGFIHVPPVEAVPLESQRWLIEQILKCSKPPR